MQRGIRILSLKRGDDQQKIFFDDAYKMKINKKKIRTGRPLRTNDFIERLEGRLKRVFKLKPEGRSKREVNE